jgi:hypothetical protein
MREEPAADSRATRGAGELFDGNVLHMPRESPA